MARAKRKGRPRARRIVSLAQTPFGGDHGTGTAAANIGTVLQAVTDEHGSNPNHIGRRLRVNRIEVMQKAGWLDIKQYQAAMEIQRAYCRVQMLSSGGALKERVQSSPKPDATVASQCDATSRWIYVMEPVLLSQRDIVEHVCCHNQPITTLGRRGHKRAAMRLKSALDRVAAHMKY